MQSWIHVLEWRATRAPGSDRALPTTGERATPTPALRDRGRAAGGRLGRRRRRARRRRRDRREEQRRLSRARLRAAAGGRDAGARQLAAVGPRAGRGARPGRAGRGRRRRRVHRPGRHGLAWRRLRRVAIGGGGPVPAGWLDGGDTDRRPCHRGHGYRATTCWRSCTPAARPAGPRRSRYGTAR